MMIKRILLLVLAACLLLTAPALAEDGVPSVQGAITAAMGTAPALAEDGERPRIILMMCYQQVGWGVRAKAAFLDEAGGVWRWESERGLPKATAERLELLWSAPDAERVDELDGRRVEELQSLIAAIQPEEVTRRSGFIADYGQNTYSAVRYGDDGAADIICLALWGDWMYEHTDINARAVYLALFTEVLGINLNSDEYEPMYQPTPFACVSLADFCGVEKSAFEGAAVTVREGGAERMLDGAEAAETLAWLQSLAVTGKRSALTPDGSETTYLLTTPEGTTAEFAFNGDLLALPDGMYTVEAPSPEEMKRLEDAKKAQDVIDRVREGIRKRQK